MKLSDRKKLYRLLEEWTKAKIMSQVSPLQWPEWGEYYYLAKEKERSIWKLLYDEEDLFRLADKWGLPTTGRLKKVKKHI